MAGCTTSTRVTLALVVLLAFGALGLLSGYGQGLPASGGQGDWEPPATASRKIAEGSMCAPPSVAGRWRTRVYRLPCWRQASSLSVIGYWSNGGR
jgi:hypothetical protein